MAHTIKVVCNLFIGHIWAEFEQFSVGGLQLGKSLNQFIDFHMRPCLNIVFSVMTRNFAP